LDRSLPAPATERAYPSPFRRRAVQDVAYHVARVAGWPLFRHYVPHAPIGAFREYMDWLVLFCTRPAAQRHAMRVLDGLDAPFFLFPMQLDSDSQIRVHSRFECMANAIDHVVASFAASAPADTHLVIKRHPLDAGTIDHADTIRRAVAAAGVGERVHYIDHPDLDLMLRAARGVVTVNSTVGIRALQLGRPVVTLGDAIYDLPGMTARDGLESFWAEQPRPDADLVAAYRRVLMRSCLVSGDYFDPEGLDAAVQHAAAGILGDPVGRAAPALSAGDPMAVDRVLETLSRPVIGSAAAPAELRMA
jgi:capsular polysaccharide export protein